MPLPETQKTQTWPPPANAHILTKMAEWDAWYTGSHDALTRAYASATHTRAPLSRPSQYAGGVVGTLARFLWGRPVADGQRDGRLHIPIAADLAQASADLLYADPPKVTSEDQKTADRLADYVDDHMATVLSAGSEIGAALGGRYHRVTWDRELADRPFLSTVHADAAIPTFRWGRLVAVTFWTRLAHNGGNGTVLRHLERHELVNGTGLVYHGLYQGTDSDLGRVIPLTEHPAVRHLATQVGADGALTEGRTPGLAVAYIPNLTPNRIWRTDQAGKDLGRSDYEGVEPLMDSLDETYSSWMRDIRVAKSRLLIPEYMTQTGKPGEGVSFDLDQEAYTTIRAAAGEDSDAPITPMQFAIRVDEHQRTAQDLVEQILRSAGYSASTFGEEESDPATATETQARKGRSLLTRGRKVRLERPALAGLATKMLLVDQAVFNTPGLDPSKPVDVDFGATVQDSPLQLAQTVEAISRAQAASVETKVQMLHPDWSPDQVETEAAKIRDEQGIGPVADPANPGLFGS
ncbi:phage portal protein [Serinicoccus sediminis]|uniref:phage portal protein n=1 Tax=Serinicoccus sediminis TaxID=2306021 RepID=UPI00101F9D02|nr:phage portal protein [Serinicoccus sediminis]